MTLSLGMRPLLIGDVIAAARVLLALPEADWVVSTDRLVWQAQVAEKYRKLFQRNHPEWGNGSLMAATACYVRKPEPLLTDQTYVRALVCVLDRLLAAQLSFVSENADLYGDCRASCEDMSHGRNKSKNGDDRPGLATDLR